MKICHKKGIHVSYLSTNKTKISTDKNYHGFYWNPIRKEIDIACFNDVDAIIHLAGATVSKRWTSSYKKEILSSRLETTQLLVDSLKTIPHQVKHIIAASAIGIYPDSLSNYYDETNSEGDDTFLSDVVKQWEAAVDVLSFQKLELD